MANLSLVRLGGLAAMAGSVAYAMANLALWLSEPPPSELIRRLDRNRTIQTLDNIFFVSLVLGALAALVSLYTLHTERYGMMGTLVCLAALGGLALALVGALGDVLRLNWYIASPLLDIMLAGLGGIGLGVVTIAARMLPWWCGGALIIEAPASHSRPYLASFAEYWWG